MTDPRSTPDETSAPVAMTSLPAGGERPAESAPADDDRAEHVQAASASNPPTAPPAPVSASPAPESPTPAQAPSDDLDLPQSPLGADYYLPDGTPTFDAVAERIQQRVATADGNQVLDEESTSGREDADGYRRLQDAGKERLDQLRKGWGMDK